MSITILVGDCRERLKDLPAASVHTVVTSPPYFGLRSYLPDDHPDKASEIGAEPSPQHFVEELVAVFREVRRVLRDDGTVWLNLGDSYAGSWGNYGGQNRGSGVSQRDISVGSSVAHAAYDGKERFRPANSRKLDGIKAKELIGIPWRVALALQADGWYLRQDIIWSKPNPMPESMSDRCTKAHEYIFLLSKSPRYFFDAEAIKEPVSQDREPSRKVNHYGTGHHSPKKRESVARGGFNGKTEAIPGRNAFRAVTETRNKRSVWTVSLRAFPDAHFATFPPDLIEPCIKSGSSMFGCCSACGAPWQRIMERTEEPREDFKGSHFDQGKTGQRDGGDRTQPGERFKMAEKGSAPTCSCEGASTVPCTVLDPFFGAGTTGLVSDRLQRRCIGVELSRDYADMAEKRLRKDVGMLLQIEVKEKAA